MYVINGSNGQQFKVKCDSVFDAVEWLEDNVSEWEFNNIDWRIEKDV